MCLASQASFLMPPFADEPVEKSSRPLGFLSFRHAPKQRTPPSLFGPEAAETAGDCGDVGPVARSSQKRPFQEDGYESGDENPKAGISKVAHQPKASSSSVFGDEGSEDESGTATNTGTAPFGEEAGESDETNSSNDESTFQIKSDTVFAFGWSSVSGFQKATFWRENMKDEKAIKPKRAYDNSNRSKNAVYARENSKGYYKRNGVDPARLQKLFNATMCSCAFDFRFPYGVCRFHLL